MGFWENITVALAGLKSNKMRAFLTMLGIIIGIGSVIAISTLGSIMEAGVMEIFNSQGGANLIGFNIRLKDGADRDYFLFEDAITMDQIKEMQEEFSTEIATVAVQSGSLQGKIRIHRKEYDATVCGVNAGYITQSMTKVLEGRYITDTDCEQIRNICVISDRQAKKIYGSNRAALGRRISVTMEGQIQDFTVVGVYQFQLPRMMAQMLSMMGDDDWNSEIFIPYTTSNRIMGNNDDAFFNFSISTQNVSDLEEVGKRVKGYINSKYYRDNTAVEILFSTATAELAMINNILGMLQLAISVIAGISLLVGGIGVMNIMLVSVTERTREIGVRKAMGAPNSAIRIQFVVESIIICLIGGVIGILFGIGLGNIAGLIVGTMASPSIDSIMLAVGFSMAIGVFFGYYPANKAAKLDPIEALRYE